MLLKHLIRITLYAMLSNVAGIRGVARIFERGFPLVDADHDELIIKYQVF